MDFFDSQYLSIALGIVSALILFLFAIENLSKEIQELATEKFRTVISHIAKNKYLAILFGAFSTAIVQSSSAITVITVILVNTGIISFKNSLGIIFGSNIGTTITAQLVLLESSILAPILIIVGFLLGLLGRKSKLLSKSIFFLGFILFALSLLSSNIEPLKTNPDVISLLSSFSNPLLAYCVSALFTGVIHSSSVTTGIIVILTQTGLIPLEVAVPMILGANLGSSVTAFLASLKLNLYSRRVGIANFLFNLIGTLLFIVLLSPFIWLLQQLTDNIAMQAALAHVLCNVFNTILFTILLNPFEKLVISLVKGNEEEILFNTRYVKNNSKVHLPTRKKILNIKKEIVYSLENTVKIYQKAISIFYNPSSITQMNIHKLETLNDFLDDEITRSILEISQFKLSKKSAHSTVILVKISNTIEQIGDLGWDLSEVFLRMHRLGIPTREVNIEKLTDIHNRLINLIKDIGLNIQKTSIPKLHAIKAKEEEISALITEQYDIHLQRLQTEDKYNGNIFVDAISVIESSVYKVRTIRKLLLKQIKEN